MPILIPILSHLYIYILPLLFCHSPFLVWNILTILLICHPNLARHYSQFILWLLAIHLTCSISSMDCSIQYYPIIFLYQRAFNKRYVSATPLKSLPGTPSKGGLLAALDRVDGGNSRSPAKRPGVLGYFSPKK